MAKEKILFISHDPFSDVGSNGKTYSSLFSDFENNEIAQLYFNRLLPSSQKFNNFFKVTDIDIMKYLFTFSGNKITGVVQKEQIDKNIKEIAAGADILIAAIGQQGFVTADMVKDGAVVIDVGIHRIISATSPTGFRMVGDVDFDNVASKCSYITPVPGGVGPMTIVALLQNTFKAYRGEFLPQ